MAFNFLIHCGVPKTASSTIQSILDTNAGYLLSRGFLYPKAGRTDHSKAHYLLHQAMAREKQSSGFVELEKIAGDILREADDMSCSNIILSCEMFAYISNKESWNTFFQCFGVEWHARFLFYTRRRDSWIKAWHRQAVKVKHATDTLQQFSERNTDNFDYAINNVISLVGESRVEVRRYEDFKDKFSIIDHFFCSWMGFVSPDLELPEPVNVTPNLDQLVRIRRMNMISGLSKKQRSMITEAILNPVTDEERDCFF